MEYHDLNPFSPTHKANATFYLIPFSNTSCVLKQWKQQKEHLIHNKKRSIISHYGCRIDVKMVCCRKLFKCCFLWVYLYFQGITGQKVLICVLIFIFNNLISMASKNGQNDLIIFKPVTTFTYLL